MLLLLSCMDDILMLLFTSNRAYASFLRRQPTWLLMLLLLSRQVGTTEYRPILCIKIYALLIQESCQVFTGVALPL